MQANAKYIPLSKPERPAKSVIRVVDSACAVCGSFRCALVLKGKDRDFNNTTTDVFTLVRCAQCGLIYLNPRPSTGELGAIYPPTYPSYNHDFQRATTTFGLDKRLKQILSLLPPPEGERRTGVLHLGSGDGYVLKRLNDLAGNELETHALDVSLQAVVVAAAHGHMTYPGFAEESKLPYNDFDLILLGHLLQRVTDPRLLLLSVFECLRPGGIAWLECANIDAPSIQWLQEGAWGGYQIPRNWFLFNRKHIEQLAAEVRFEFAHFAYSRQGQYWRAKGSIATVKGTQLAKKVSRRLSCDFGTALEAAGQTSNMLIALKKPS